MDTWKTAFEGFIHAKSSRKRGEAKNKVRVIVLCTTWVEKSDMPMEECVLLEEVMYRMAEEAKIVMSAILQWSHHIFREEKLSKVPKMGYRNAKVGVRARILKYSTLSRRWLLYMERYEHESHSGQVLEHELKTLDKNGRHSQVLPKVEPKSMITSSRTQTTTNSDTELGSCQNPFDKRCQTKCSCWSSTSPKQGRQLGKVPIAHKQEFSSDSENSSNKSVRSKRRLFCKS